MVKTDLQNKRLTLKKIENSKGKERVDIKKKENSIENPIRDHSNITSAKRWVGGGGQMLMFADEVDGWGGQMLT